MWYLIKMSPESLDPILIVFTTAWGLFTPGSSYPTSPLRICCCDHWLIMPLLRHGEESKEELPFQVGIKTEELWEPDWEPALWNTAGWVQPQQEAQVALCLTVLSSQWFKKAACCLGGTAETLWEMSSRTAFETWQSHGTYFVDVCVFLELSDSFICFPLEMTVSVESEALYFESI